MMFAQGVKLNVLDQDNLARIRLENRIVNNLIEVLPITLREKFECSRRAVRGASQAFAIEIFADSLKQFAVGFGDSVEVPFP